MGFGGVGVRGKASLLSPAATCQMNDGNIPLPTTWGLCENHLLLAKIITILVDLIETLG